MPFPSRSRDTMGHGRHEAYTQAPAFASASPIASVTPTRGGDSINEHRIPPRATSGEVGNDDPNQLLNHDEQEPTNESEHETKIKEAPQLNQDLDATCRNRDVTKIPQGNEQTYSEQIPTIVAPPPSPEDGVAPLAIEHSADTTSQPSSKNKSGQTSPARKISTHTKEEKPGPGTTAKHNKANAAAPASPHSILHGAHWEAEA